MNYLRRAEQRGHANYGWLDSRHSFSFGSYHDPRHTGFNSLRVINDDRVQPGQGFGTHGHRDMEILTYVVDGTLAHRDDLGNGSIIRPGEIQLMRAGTGILHSEFNASDTELVHFLQIWIMPNQTDLAPGYQQHTFARDANRGDLLLLASTTGRSGSLVISQDVDLYVATLDAGETIRHRLASERQAWLQVVAGTVDVETDDTRTTLGTGDGLGVTDTTELALKSEHSAEILLFDLGAYQTPARTGTRGQ